MCKETLSKTLTEANNSTGYFMPVWVMDELKKHIPSGVMKRAENQCHAFGTEKEYRLESVRNGSITRLLQIKSLKVLHNLYFAYFI